MYLQPTQATTAIDVLRKLLHARWDPVSQLLDLANLAQDKILMAGGIPAPGQKGAPLKTASAIWKLCQEMYPNIRSLSLADNNLKSLQPMSMSSLVTTLPGLENLSLAGNQLASFSDLHSISPVSRGHPSGTGVQLGFAQLRELILTGNPLRTAAQSAGPKGLENYLYEACRRFPSLQVLDGEKIDSVVRANIQPVLPSARNVNLPISTPTSTSQMSPAALEPVWPLSVKPAFLGDQSTATFVAAFCLQFFAAFDENRDSLADVYATRATFSLCASPFIPIRAKAAGITRNRPDMPAQQVPSWSEYISMSRNNAKLHGPRLSDRISTGPAEILHRMKLIPRTKHPLSNTADQHKFVVDAWQMPGLVTEATSAGGAVIYVSIHGEFQEFPSLTIRSFDRTFVLGAAGPATAAALKGWPCSILTDQLTVRGYSSPSAWAPESGTVATTSDLTVEQQNLANQLMQSTNLNKQFTVECLTQNGWDLARALVNFQEINAAGVLPPDAFLTSPST